MTRGLVIPKEARLPSRRLALSAFLLTMPALAFAQARPPNSVITFTLPDAGRGADWPIAVRTVAIGGRTIRLDRPVQVQNGWVPTATITLRNVSPKTIVSGGMGFVFPAAGDGTQARPRAACWPVQQGQVPKLVWLGRDGVYHLPPGWERQKPLQLAPGAAIRLTFTTCGQDTDTTLAGGRLRQAVLTFETFYFADGSRWSAEQYALPPLAGTRSWRMVRRDEFVRSAKNNP
jgi:hypothetical protein